LKLGVVGDGGAPANPGGVVAGCGGEGEKDDRVENERRKEEDTHERVFVMRRIVEKKLS
jgi:hypothetical protein